MLGNKNKFIWKYIFCYRFPTIPYHLYLSLHHRQQGPGQNVYLNFTKKMSTVENIIIFFIMCLCSQDVLEFKAIHNFKMKKKNV